MAHNNNKCYLIIYKGEGKFCKAKDIDAYILNIIFNYRVIKNQCGFPDNVLNKVIKELEDNKINYQIISSDANPVIKNFKKTNKYDIFALKAKKNIGIISKLNDLEHKVKNASKEELLELLEKIDEFL